MYIPFWILLILHGPNFWKWFIVPGIVYILERAYRIFFVTERGKTYISSGLLLPSKVTHLVIKRPVPFDFHPGDYVFVNIPAIAKYEWHPFTISSAPEQDGEIFLYTSLNSMLTKLRIDSFYKMHDTFSINQTIIYIYITDYMWLHIRGVGQWTNRLYEYFEKEQEKLHNGEIAPLVPNSVNKSTINGNIENNNQSPLKKIQATITRTLSNRDKNRKNEVQLIGYSKETISEHLPQKETAQKACCSTSGKHLNAKAPTARVSIFILSFGLEPS